MPRLKLKQIAGPGAQQAGYGLKISSDGGTIDYFDLSDVGEKGPLGYFATVYTVADEAAKNAIDTTKIKPGDQAYVINDGNNKWAQYLASSMSTDTPPVVTWTKIADEDSANSASSAKTKSVSLTYQTPSPVLISSISPTLRVIEVTIEVTETFNNSSLITVGDDSDNSRLASSDNIDLTTLGTYVTTPSYQYNGTENTEVNVYLTPGTTSSGAVTVTISYI